MRANLLGILLLSASCAAPVRGTVIGAPAEFPGYPSQAKSGVVWCEATYFTNHKSVFGTDLVRRGVLPIAVRLGLRADDGEAHRLADDFDPHIYLQDGTSLDWVPLAKAGWKNRELNDRVASLGLRPGLLDDWERTSQRFLFFRLPPDARVDGDKVLVPHGDHYRSVDLLQSLLAFDVSSEEGVHTVHVGLSSGRWTNRR